MERIKYISKMSESKYLKGQPETKSGGQTSRVNVFDQTMTGTQPEYLKKLMVHL